MPIAGIPAVAPSAHNSEGFLKDILSDGSGVSVHRFQMFAWTVVLALVFVVSVYNELAMPVFDAMPGRQRSS